MDEIPRPAAHVFVNDPEALAGAIQGSVLRPVRLTGTPGTSELARLMMPASCLDFVRLGNPMLFSGAMTSQGYTLVFVLDCPRSARAFNFSTDYTGGYLGFFPPGGLLDSTTSAGYANVTLTVPTEVFLEAVSHHFPGINDTLLTRGAGLRIPPPIKPRSASSSPKSIVSSRRVPIFSPIPSPCASSNRRSSRLSSAPFVAASGTSSLPRLHVSPGANIACGRPAR